MTREQRKIWTARVQAVSLAVFVSGVLGIAELGVYGWAFIGIGAVGSFAAFVAETRAGR